MIGVTTAHVNLPNALVANRNGSSAPQIANLQASGSKDAISPRLPSTRQLLIGGNESSDSEQTSTVNAAAKLELKSPNAPSPPKPGLVHWSWTAIIAVFAAGIGASAVGGYASAEHCKAARRETILQTQLQRTANAYARLANAVQTANKRPDS